MNYYEELGLNEHATIDDIKHAYRQLAKKYHPDKNPDNTQAAKRFVWIATAYETLSDKEKRQAYDESLKGARTKKASYQRKSESTPEVNPMNMSGFESFFGFTAKSDQVVPADKKTQSKTNPVDTSQLFEKFFGR